MFAKTFQISIEQNSTYRYFIQKTGSWDFMINTWSKTLSNTRYLCLMEISLLRFVSNLHSERAPVRFSVRYWACSILTSKHLTASFLWIQEIRNFLRIQLTNRVQNNSISKWQNDFIMCCSIINNRTTKTELDTHNVRAYHNIIQPALFWLFFNYMRGFFTWLQSHLRYFTLIAAEKKKAIFCTFHFTNRLVMNSFDVIDPLSLGTDNGFLSYVSTLTSFSFYLP